MKNEPPTRQLGERPSDETFPFRSTTPRPLVGVGTQ
jgi:hypothetical protein